MPNTIALLVRVVNVFLSKAMLLILNDEFELKK
jgi:hypothetical protein